MLNNNLLNLRQKHCRSIYRTFPLWRKTTFWG